MKKSRFAWMGLIVCGFVAQNASASSMKYMKLSGQIKTMSSSAIIDDLQQKLITPLKGIAVVSFNSQANGTGDFFFNLLAEPVSPAQTDAFNNALSVLEKQGFEGMAVQFVGVSQIFETTNFEAGVYKGDGADFVSSFGLSRSFAFSSLSDWTAFINKTGFALMDRSGTRYLDYLKGFVGSSEDYDLMIQSLKQNNQIEIASLPYLILDDNTVIEPTPPATPFFPYTFHRDCWSPDYENGNCISVSRF